MRRTGIGESSIRRSCRPAASTENATHGHIPAILAGYTDGASCTKLKRKTPEDELWPSASQASAHHRCWGRRKTRRSIDCLRPDRRMPLPCRWRRTLFVERTLPSRAPTTHAPLSGSGPECIASRLAQSLHRRCGRASWSRYRSAWLQSRPSGGRRRSCCGTDRRGGVRDGRLRAYHSDPGWRERGGSCKDAHARRCWTSATGFGSALRRNGATLQRVSG